MKGVRHSPLRRKSGMACNLMDGKPHPVEGRRAALLVLDTHLGKDAQPRIKACRHRKGTMLTT